MKLLLDLTSPYRGILPKFGLTMITCTWYVTENNMAIRQIASSPPGPAGIGLSARSKTGWTRLLTKAPHVANLLKTAMHYYESFLDDIDEMPSMSTLRHEFIITNSAKFTELVLNKNTEWNMRCEIEIPDLSTHIKDVLRANCPLQKRTIKNTSLILQKPIRIIWNPFFDSEVEHAEILFKEEINKGRRAYKTNGDCWKRIFNFSPDSGEVLLAYPKRAGEAGQTAHMEKTISLAELHKKIKAVLEKYKHRKVTFKMEEPNGHRILCETSS